MNILKAPYIKGKNFCPNPVVKFGIPKYADSRFNPKVLGTPDHQKWWEEQLYYIHNGYQTGGMLLPGRFYYYMNFRTFETVLGPINAEYCDLHLELAYFIDWCKKEHKNALFPKGRRKGISEAANTMIMDHGYRFTYGYHAGIAAGLEDYVNDFMTKWENFDTQIVPELFTKRNNDPNEKIAMYKITDENGDKREDGTKNTIYSRTAFLNANVFKGKFLNDIFAEECGEFDLIIDFFEASKDCLKFGEIQAGNFWGYGTGGKMAGASKLFEKMWNEYNSYNMERFFIPATRYYFPYYGGCKEVDGMKEKTPNLQHLKPYERYGVEDLKGAEEAILAFRKQKLDAGDIKGYIEECQNNPLDIKEVFRRASSNNFNIDILNERGLVLGSTPPNYSKYKLIRKGNQVTCEPAKQTDAEEDCVLIADGYHPKKNYQYLYCAGLDSYDQDQSKTSKSLGAMCVRIRDHSITGLQRNKPVAIIRCRPKRKEQFYEMCLCLAIYYDLVGAVLVDVAKALVIEYFKQNEMSIYLAKRPKKFESINSDQQHEYGVSLNTFSRPRMIALMQSDVLDNARKWDFPDLIEEHKNFDEFQKDSDNDLADAHGISLMQDMAMNIESFDESEEKRQKQFELGDSDLFKEKAKLLSAEQDHDGFGL